MQDKNDNNPFQVDQSPVQPSDNNGVAPAPPAAEAPTAPIKQRPVIALDGVSPSYDDNYAESVTPTPEPAVESTHPIDTNASAYSQPQDVNSAADQFTANPTPDDQSYANPLLNVDTNTASDDYAQTVPKLADPDATAIEINKTNGMTFRAWQFFLALGVAVIGVAGTVFFVVEYNQTNASFQETLGQLEEYRNQAETSQKAAQQLGDLQDTVRDQAEKITTLKEENDTLKKSSDELKTLKEENAKLKQEKEDLVNSLAKLAP